MSLVPFSPASPGATRAPAVLPRAGVSPPGTPAGPSTYAAVRAAGARADTHAGPAVRNDDEGFASVLAAARESVSDASAAGERASSPPAMPTSDGSDLHEVSSETPAAQPPDDARQPSPATSWLLLALQHAPLVRSCDSGAGHDDADGAGDEGASHVVALDPAGDPGAAIAPAPVLTGAPVPTSSGPTSAVPTGAGQGAPAVGAAVGAAAGVPGEPAGGGASPTLVPIGNRSDVAGDPQQDEVAADGLTTASTIAAATLPAHADEGAPIADAGPDGVTAHAMVRRRPWTQAGGDDSGTPAGTRGEVVAGGGAGREQVSIAGEVPGTAVSRLAQAVGRQEEPEHVPALPAVAGPAGDAATAASAVVPSARALEVLQRLSDTIGSHATNRQDAAGPARPDVTDMAGILAIASSNVTAAARTDAAASVSHTAPLPPAVGEQVGAQIVSSLKMQWKDGIGEARLHLRPDALGAVTVMLRVEQGAVTAVVRADSPQVQDWVVQHQQTLRQQMEAAGLRLDDLSVNPDDRQQRQQPHGGHPEQQRRHARRDKARSDGRTFEVLA